MSIQDIFAAKDLKTKITECIEYLQSTQQDSREFDHYLDEFDLLQQAVDEAAKKITVKKNSRVSREILYDLQWNLIKSADYLDKAIEYLKDSNNDSNKELEHYYFKYIDDVDYIEVLVKHKIPFPENYIYRYLEEGPDFVNIDFLTFIKDHYKMSKTEKKETVKMCREIIKNLKETIKIEKIDDENDSIYHQSDRYKTALKILLNF